MLFQQQLWWIKTSQRPCLLLQLPNMNQLNALLSLVTLHLLISSGNDGGLLHSSTSGWISTLADVFRGEVIAAALLSVKPVVGTLVARQEYQRFAGSIPGWFSGFLPQSHSECTCFHGIALIGPWLVLTQSLWVLRSHKPMQIWLKGNSLLLDWHSKCECVVMLNWWTVQGVTGPWRLWIPPTPLPSVLYVL